MKFSHVPKVGDVYVVKSKMYNDGSVNWKLQPGDKVVVSSVDAIRVVVVNGQGEYLSLSTKGFAVKSQLL